MVSIIILVYNGQHYIRSIVDDFARQVYKDFELVFVNDGSTDDSLKYLQACQEESQIRIRLVDQSNQGVSSARNAGIAEACGDWLCFVDVDDAVAETYLSDMFSVTTKEDVQMVFCRHESIKVLSDRDRRKNAGTGATVVVDRLTCLRGFLYGKLKSGCCTLMVKAEVLKANQLEFATGTAKTFTWYGGLLRTALMWHTLIGPYITMFSVRVQPCRSLTRVALMVTG